MDLATAEMVVKGLSRGVVTFVAMAPPKDVTGSGFTSATTPPHHNSPSTPHLPPPPPSSPLPEAIDEPGIIKAKVYCAYLLYSNFSR